MMLSLLMNIYYTFNYHYPLYYKYCNKRMSIETTQSLQNTSNPHKDKHSHGLFRILDFVLMLLYLCCKIMFIPMTYMFNLGVGFVNLVGKTAKLGLTFVMNGIQGVQKALRIGTFA